MSVDIETIGVAVDSSGVVKGTRDLDKFGASANKASKDADSFGKTTSTVSKKTEELSGSTNLATNSLKSLAAAYVGLNGARALIGAIDNYTKYNAQLKLATRSQDEFNQALRDVSKIANLAQADLSSIGVLYARITNAARDLGASQIEVARITENVGLALKVSGATAQESASAMLQLSQAFGAGVLRGEEFNAVNEAAPALMRALAESIGVPIGQLRNLASEGQITGDVLIRAFGDEKLLEQFRSQAKEVQTIAGAWQTLKNEVLLSVGAINEATGASNLFIKSMTAMSDFIGKGSPFQLFGFAARATQNRFNQAIGTAGGGRGGNGNQVPGMAAVTGGNFSPNFSATVEVQDINKIHQMQEESARKSKEAHDKYLRNIEDKKRKESQFADYQTRLREELKQKEEELNVATYKTAEKLEKAEYERKQKYMEMLQKQANANYEEAQKKVKELNDEAAQIGETLSRSLTDAIFRGFEAGKSFAQNFRDTLINTFRTLVLQPIIRFLVDSSGITKVLAAFGSAFSGNAVAGEGGVLSSLKNGFSSITDIFKSGNSSIVSSIESLGAFLSTGNGGLGDTIGGLLGQYSSQIADGFGYFGAALQLAQGNVGGALGAGIGTFFGGPVGGAIGSFIGGALGGLFGGSTPKRNWARVDSTFKDGQFAVTNTFAKRDGGSALDPQIQLQRAFSETLGSFLKSFGLNPNISIAGNFSTRPGKSTTASFYPIVDGMLSGGEFRYGKRDGQAFQKYVDSVLGSTLAITIRNSNLSNGIKKFFEDLTSGLTKKEDVLNTINALTALNTALEDLPPIFNAVRNAIDTTAYKTSIDALQAQFKATQTFVDLFYSDAEKFNIFQGQLQSQFADLNKTIPTSRDQYRALVESINVVDEATRDQFNGLIALAPAMKQYFDYLEQQADGINQVNEAIAQGLDRNLFSTYADFVTAQANASAGLTYTGSIGDLSVRRAQGDAELANAVKSLVAQQARTDQILAEIAESTRRTREINERWNGDGLPETRVI